MTISRAVKLRPLFQEVTLASPEAQSIQIWYQVKYMDIILLFFFDMSKKIRDPEAKIGPQDLVLT